MNLLPATPKSNRRGYQHHFRLCVLVFSVSLGHVVCAQAPAGASAVSPVKTSGLPGQADAASTLRLYHLDGLTAQLQEQGTGCGAPTLLQLTTRVSFADVIQVSMLDVDSVIAELSNERGELSDLRASLQQRRDKSVARLMNAALITGSALGAAVSATQFTTLPTTAQNTGDAVGIGAGIASTVLSVLANRAQAGPPGTVGQTPNMLAPLLGGEPILESAYPPEVFAFLNTSPSNAAGPQPSRLDSLKASWVKAGRLPAEGSKANLVKIAALTSSGDPSVKVTIADLTDRIAMLGDVIGRVALLRRDLAGIARIYLRNGAECEGVTSP